MRAFLTTIAMTIFVTGSSASERASGVPGLANGYAFVNVNVIPVITEGSIADQTVVVSGGRIVAVGNSTDVDIPGGLMIIDGSGRYLLPGLADMHAHPMTEDDLTLYLANGVTLIRALWGEPSLLELRDRVASGALAGPRIYTAGRIVDGSTPIHFGTVPLNDPADAENAMLGQIDAGFDFVKIYSLVSPEVFDAMAEAAAAHGIELSGHLPAAVSIDRGFDAGMRTMEHMSGFHAATQADSVKVSLEAFFGDAEAKAFVEAIGRGDVGRDSLFDASRVDATVQKAAQSNTWIVPTLTVLRSVSGLHTLEPPTARYLSVATRHFWRTFAPILQMAFTPDSVAGQKILYGQHENVLRRIYDAGGKILVGTDAPNPGVMTGFAVIDEIRLLAEAGLGNQGALRAATLEPAIYMNEADERGHLTEGAVADLLLVNSNPLDDVANLRDVAGVMRSSAGDSNWYESTDLRAKLDDIAERSAALEARLNRAPLPEAMPMARADFMSANDDHLALLVARSPDSTVVEAAQTVNGGWQSFKLVRDAEATVLLSVTADYRLSDTDNGRVLRRNEAVIKTSSDIGIPAVLLSGTQADLAILHDVFSGVEIGGRMAVEAWRCESGLQCDTPTIETWNVTRENDDVLDGHFYYTGVRVFRVSRDRAEIGNLYIGGGAYEGQPVRMELLGSESAAKLTRVR